MNKEVHLYNRAGFGVPIQEVKLKSAAALLSSATRDNPIKIIDPSEVDNRDLIKMTQEERKEKFKKSKKDTLLLNTTWLEQMSFPEAFVREKMTFFWHDHFACRTQAAYLVQQQNNVIRKHALGSFRKLLPAVSKDPAMLQFLNNQQNKKDSPNENFAREVMELFTLGRGNYTEADIKNAARAFTGWAFNPKTGEYIFKPRVHDDGKKDFRGKRGNFSGDDILEFILEDEQTAEFITNKIWNYFVSQDVVDKEIVKSLAAGFYQSGYDIEKLMKTIFQSSWFYEDRFMGNRIKSPIELVVGMQFHTGGSFADEASQLFIQRAMSQILFYPPNVGGWPQGREWIDGSSLTFRMSLPAVMLRNEEPTIQAKDDGDVNNLTNQVRKSKISFSVDWTPIANRFIKDNTENTLLEMESFLLSRPTTAENRLLVSKYASGASNDLEMVKRAYVSYMSLPEYQLN